MKKIFIILIFLSFFGVVDASTISAIPTARLNQGLVGYWSFDGNTIVNGAVRDLSGNGNTGNPMSIATSTFYTSGKIGQGVRFQVSTTNRINISGISVGTTASVVAWIYPVPAPTGGATYALIFAASNAAGFFYTRGGSTVNKLNYYCDTDHFSATAMTPNKWHHVAAVSNANSVTFYLDGVADGTASCGSYTGFTANRIGGDTTALNQFNGVIDDLRAYNRALSPTEIKALYKMGQATINKIPIVRLNKGLVGYWSFDGSTIVNGAVRDLSGNNYTSYPVNISTSTFYTSGKVGQGVSFDGVNDWVNTSATINQSSLTTISYSFWFNSKVSTANFIIAWDGIRCSLGGVVTGKVTCTADGNVNGGATSNNVINNNIWHHVVYVVNGNSQTIYIDGVFNNTASETLSSPNQMVSLGASNAGSLFYKGYLDDVRIYNRLLNPSEINALYKMGQATINKTPVNRLNKGLVGYWTFDGKNVVNGAIRDISGNGNTGYPTNISTSTFYTSGKIGQGVRFDGVDDVVSISDSDSLGNGNTTMTWSFWAKQNLFTDLAGLLDKYVTTGSQRSWRIVTDSSNRIELTSSSDGSSGTISISNSNCGITSNNVWTHFVVVYVGGQKPIFYKNGAFCSEGNTTAPASLYNNTANLNIGFGQGTSAYFNGSLDDVRIYSRALSPAEVYQLYNMGR